MYELQIYTTVYFNCFNFPSEKAFFSDAIPALGTIKQLLIDDET